MIGKSIRRKMRSPSNRASFIASLRKREQETPNAPMALTACPASASLDRPLSAEVSDVHSLLPLAQAQPHAYAVAAFQRNHALPRVLIRYTAIMPPGETLTERANLPADRVSATRTPRDVPSETRDSV